MKLDMTLIISKINTRWRFVIAAFLVTTFGCWTFFAMIWYLIAYAHNDLTLDSATGLPLHDGARTCIRGVETLTGFFLYSFEIQVKLLRKCLNLIEEIINSI